MNGVETYNSEGVCEECGEVIWHCLERDEWLHAFIDFSDTDKEHPCTPLMYVTDDEVVLHLSHLNLIDKALQCRTTT